MTAASGQSQHRQQPVLHPMLLPRAAPAAGAAEVAEANAAGTAKEARMPRRALRRRQSWARQSAHASWCGGSNGACGRGRGCKGIECCVRDGSGGRRVRTQRSHWERRGHQARQPLVPAPASVEAHRANRTRPPHVPRAQRVQQSWRSRQSLPVPRQPGGRCRRCKRGGRSTLSEECH